MIKKIIFTFSLLLSSISLVSASTANPSYFHLSNFYNKYEMYSMYGSQFSSEIDTLIQYWDTNYKSTYPHYFITIEKSGTDWLYISLFPTLTNEINAIRIGNSAEFTIISKTGSRSYYQYHYNLSTNVGGFSELTSNDNQFSNMIYSSDIDFVFKDSNNCSSNNYGCYDTLTIPSYSNLTLDVSYPQLDIANNDVIPTFTSLSSEFPSADFTTVNLNDYAYIILSLKNYNTTAFNTTIYTQGKLCFTPVYDYGMKEKYTYYSGYQTMGCSETYSTLTPVPIYIIQDDLTYHSVYYIKPYETLTTTLKIPTAIFDITYVSQQNADNPNVIIDGRSYPSIPFSQLVDTANKSSEEGYISGQVCVLGDINCTASQNNFSIEDIFTSPLQTLRTVWSSIVSVFALITGFIILLPPVLQAFLYASFFLAIILGVLKIIL